MDFVQGTVIYNQNYQTLRRTQNENIQNWQKRWRIALVDVKRDGIDIIGNISKEVTRDDPEKMVGQYEKSIKIG